MPRRSALAAAAALAAVTNGPPRFRTASSFCPPPASPSRHRQRAVPGGLTFLPDRSTVLRVSKSRPGPSKIVDEDGPTPPPPPFEPPIRDAAEIEKMMEYDPTNHVVPHQPWRRGDTDGCHDPIDSQWRLEAEHVIETAAGAVGAYVEDVTWYLTFVVVTLSPDLSRVDPDKAAPGVTTPEVKVETTSPKTNVYLEGPDDPDDPSGFPVGSFGGEEHARVGPEWDDEDDDEDDDEPQYDEETGEELPRPRRPTRSEAVFAYRAEKAQEREERGSRERWLKLPGLVQPHNVRDDVKDRYDGYLKDISDFEALLVDKYGYTPDDEDLTEQDLEDVLTLLNEEWGLDRDRLLEYKSWILEKYRLVDAYSGVNPKVNDMDVRADGLTEDYANRLSRVAGSIRDALGEDDVDSRLDILDRHEVVLTSSNFDPLVVETQRQFDSNRGNDVFVHTQDPWNSNRILKGKLVDRNAMDVILNQGGRMVTVPNNMVAFVALPERNVERGAEIDGLLAEVDEAEAAMRLAEMEEGAEDVEYEYEEEEWDEEDDEEEYEYEEEDEEEEYEEEVEEEWDDEEEEEEEEEEEVEEEEVEDEDEDEK